MNIKTSFEILNNKCINFLNRDRSTANILFILLIAALFFRLVYIFASPFWDGDTFFYLEGAVTINSGGILYLDYGDIKPPGIFYLFSLVRFISGPEMFPIGLKVLSILFLTLTGFYFYKISEALQKEKNALLFSLLIIIALSTRTRFWEENIFFLMMYPFSITLYYTIRNNFSFKKMDIILAGIFSGLLFLLSSNMIVYTLIFPVLGYWKNKSMRESISISLFAFIGFIIPIGVFLGYFWYHNAFKEVYWWTIEWARIYSNARSFPVKISNLFYGLVKNWEFIPIYIISGFGTYRIVKERLYKNNPGAFFALLILFLSILSRVFLGKSVIRYNLYMWPGIIFTAMYANLKFVQLSIKTAAFLFLVAILLYTNIKGIIDPYMTWTKQHDKGSINEWIIKNTSESDKIFVWVKGAKFYYNTNRKMATSFFNVQQHLYSPSWEKEHSVEIKERWDKFFNELYRDKPAVIVDPKPEFYVHLKYNHKEFLSKMQNKLIAYVKAHYTLELAEETIHLWKRKKE